MALGLSNHDKLSSGFNAYPLTRNYEDNNHILFEQSPSEGSSLLKLRLVICKY